MRNTLAFVRRHGIAFAALVFALGGTSYAVAAASTGGSVITVCVRHNGSVLYAAKKCGRHDSRLTWNKQGIQGPQGAQGVPGSQGVQGVSGLQGATGPAGPSAFSARISGLSGTQDAGAPSGLSTAVGLGSIASVQTLSPSVPMVGRDLSAMFTSPVPGGSSFTVRLEVNGVDALICDVPAGGTTCSNSTDTASIPAGSTLAFFVGDTIGFNTLTGSVLIGWRATAS